MFDRVNAAYSVIVVSSDYKGFFLVGIGVQVVQ